MRNLVKDWTGAEVSDEEIDQALEAWTDDPRAVERAALTLLRRRHGELTANGALGQDPRGALARKIRALEDDLGDEPLAMPLAPDPRRSAA